MHEKQQSQNGKPLAKRPGSCRLQLPPDTPSKHLLSSPSALLQLLPQPQWQMPPPLLSSKAQQPAAKVSDGDTQQSCSGQLRQLTTLKNSNGRTNTTRSVFKFQTWIAWAVACASNTMRFLHLKDTIHCVVTAITVMVTVFCNMCCHCCSVIYLLIIIE